MLSLAFWLGDVDSWILRKPGLSGSGFKTFGL